MARKGRFMKGIAGTGFCLVLAGAIGLQLLAGRDKGSVPEGFAVGNGRLEATETDIAVKAPGRLVEVLVKEGDPVDKDQVLAVMDTLTLNAMLRQAEAEVERAKQARTAARYRVEECGNRMALAGKELQRARTLFEKGIATQQQLDRDETLLQAYAAEYAGLKSQVAEAGAAVQSAVAQTERLRAEIGDCVLKSYGKGRVQARLAEPGEVLPAGGKVLTVIATNDMYMNVFLPEKQAGEAAIGAEARIVTDAFPENPLPAKVVFVSEKAQFTPKEVEASQERQKLMFRVKVRLQEGHGTAVKPGMPGVAYIRLHDSVRWSDALK